MLQIKNSNFKRVGVLVGLGLIASLGIVTLNPSETHAADCTAGSPYSCVSATFGKLSGETTATPGKETKSRLYFSMPLTITMNQVKNYSVSIYDSNGGALKAGSSTIPSVSSATSWKQLSDASRAWGFRYTAGKTDDGTKDFQPIPTSSNQTTIADKIAVSNRGGTVADYTLGFGVVVDGSTAAGDYTDTLTVAVVAQPRDITIFDIKNMQDMTTDICKATTTPSATIAGATTNNGPTDTDGSHASDPQYVPETTLIDTRDGKSYLVRKLADGNCWMSQNLELDILGKNQEITNYKTSTAKAGNDNIAVTADNYFGTEVTDGLVFTANDTDLNSTSIWTPEYFKKTYVEPENSMAPYAKVYTTMSSTITASDATYGWANNGNDGIRSYSYNASNPDWNYSSEPNESNLDTDGHFLFSDSATGEPYARRGNLCNWTAATLGSSLKLTQDNSRAEDSICPRGWQLPDSGTKSDLTATIDTIADKTFTKLFRSYGMIINTDHVVANFNRMNEWPLQFLRVGIYSRSQGFVHARINDSRWWTSTAQSDIYGYFIGSWTKKFSTCESFYRGTGNAIRCVAR